MTEAEKKQLTFNWHDLPDGSFLKYAWIALLRGVEDWKDLMAQTKDGKAITLTIHANGLEMNAASLMEGLERNYELAVQRGIEAKVQEADLEGLSEDVRKAEKAVREVFRAKFNKLGIEWEEREEW